VTFKWHLKITPDQKSCMTSRKSSSMTCYECVLNICRIIIKLRDINNWITLEWPLKVTQGHTSWPRLKDPIWVQMCSILSAGLPGTKTKLLTIKNWVTLTGPLKVTQGQSLWCYSHMMSCMCSILNIHLSGTKTKLLTNHLKALIIFLYVLYTKYMPDGHQNQVLGHLTLMPKCP
jgi:hypothetical protein